MKIKFLDKNIIYKIDSFDTIIYDKIVQIKGTNLPQNKSGFILLDDNERLINSYEDYKVIFKLIDQNTIQFSNDTTIYKVYRMFNDEGYITHQIITADNLNNGIVVDKGSTAAVVNAEYPELFDADGFYLYKVVNNKIVNTTSEDKEPWMEEKLAKELEEAKAQKKNEISSHCQAGIFRGIELNGKRYSYDFADQNNIFNLVTLALQTGLSVPYHADGESVKLFTKNEIAEIYANEEMNVTHNTAYNNQMKNYIDNLDNIEVIKAINYGDALQGEYLEIYNTMVEQARQTIEAFINR